MHRAAIRAGWEYFGPHARGWFARRRNRKKTNSQTLWRCYVKTFGRISKPAPPDRGPTRLRGRSHFGAAKARSAAAELAERLRNPPDHLDRATCCGRGPPARRWECQDASYYLRIGQGAIGLGISKNPTAYALSE